MEETLQTSNESQKKDSALPSSPVLASYTDFRQYLSDYFDFKKFESASALRPYTYSMFSVAANIKSPNYLKLIIEGKRNLSNEMILKFAKALKLSKEDTDEFKALVQYCQSKDPLDRNQKLKRLSELRMQRQMRAGTFNTQALDAVPNWVTWVLYTLADQKDVNFELNSLMKTMKGRANQDEIKKALDRLFKTGELVKDPITGLVKKGRALMVGGPNNDPIPVELVRKLQSELIYLGLESLYQDQASEREFGAVTLSLTKREFEKVKFELRQLKKRIYKDISVKREISKGDKVYQMNIQLFPVTKDSE